MAPVPSLPTISPTINNPHQSVAYITMDEPILIHHHHPRAVVYIRFALGVHSVGLDKCVLACVCHDRISQSNFTVLRILCAPLIHPSLPNALLFFFFKLKNPMWADVPSSRLNMTAFSESSF